MWRRARSRTRPPTRLRRRVTAAFVLVAALSAGLLAVLSVVITREYRLRNIRQQSLDEARVALALAPNELDAESFERLRLEYEARAEADLFAAGGGLTFSSSAGLASSDIPAGLRELEPGELASVTAEIGDEPNFVVGATRADGDRYWFFYSLQQAEDSLRDLIRVTTVGWITTTLLAGAVGRAVARQTLAPMRRVARAAEAIASGEPARLGEGDDEFGAVARSFNRMADEVRERITELERAAERERRFTADVAHDLRTPLTGMAATASLLNRHLDDLPASARRPATLLVADVERLRSLVLELLELSQLDAGRDEVRLEPLRVTQAVEAARRSLGSKLALELDVTADPDLAVLAEPARLRRILANLLANAATHGRGSATVRAWRDGDDVLVEIVDRGPGIPEADLASVFDRFAKSDRSRASGGSGLGLAIARAHAVAQAGDLTAANDPGGGACFTLRLRAADGHDAGDPRLDVVSDRGRGRSPTSPGRSPARTPPPNDPADGGS